MAQLSPTEKTLRFATTVETLPDAWTFVMEHIQDVGPSPSIHITPYWSSDDNFNAHHFTAVVDGMIEVDKTS